MRDRRCKIVDSVVVVVENEEHVKRRVWGDGLLLLDTFSKAKENPRLSLSLISSCSIAGQTDEIAWKSERVRTFLGETR